MMYFSIATKIKVMMASIHFKYVVVNKMNKKDFLFEAFKMKLLFLVILNSFNSF